ncbi:CYTH domain-containing protein [Alloyangia pacifica]|uniref:CYTH domain-containing protein n=1 Tax=Alloyangia pacifica TaxID=311180 RepID=UPI001CD3693F|nr:CYTH domain-containing protein [Alloyangia pacifica]MCA0997073.1 CYTH domain-containing protein [Alloyangia pacifica]
MAKEIERKFLVTHEGWKASVTKSERLRDGLIAAAGGRKARVRFYDDRATLCIKGARVGLTRDEFEYPIPAQDAEEMLASHCDGEVVEKTRHYVPHGDIVWMVDVYSGLLAGIIVAEVELPQVDTPLTLPTWVGREVTGLQEYRKINMVRARRGARDSLRSA